jgi:hypothetical protein
MTATLGFFTQNELDLVVGNRRRRQRLVEGGVLPGGKHVKTFGQEAIIFPEFAAAALVAEKPTVQDAALLGRLKAAAEQLYATESFAALSEVVRAVLRAHKRSCLDDLAGALIEQSGDALRAWQEQLVDAERQLADAGILLQVQLGRIDEVSTLDYSMTLADTGEHIRVAANAVRSRLLAGTWVTRNIIELGARKGEVLVPTVDGQMLAGMRENTALVDAEDALLSEMFANTDFKPVAVPYILETDAADEPRETVPKRRFKVRANRARFAQANTMTRTGGRSHGPITAR